MNGEVINNQAIPSNNSQNMINTTVEGLTNTLGNDGIVIPNDTLNEPVIPGLQDNQNTSSNEEVILNTIMPSYTPNIVLPNDIQATTDSPSNVVSTPVVQDENNGLGVDNLTNNQPTTIQTVESTIPAVDQSSTTDEMNVVNTAAPLNNNVETNTDDSLVEQNFVTPTNVEVEAPQIDTTPNSSETPSPVLQDNSQVVVTSPGVENVGTEPTNEVPQDIINTEPSLTPAEASNLVENNQTDKLAKIQKEIADLERYNTETLARIKEELGNIQQENTNDFKRAM